MSRHSIHAVYTAYTLLLFCDAMPIRSITSKCFGWFWPYGAQLGHPSLLCQVECHHVLCISMSLRELLMSEENISPRVNYFQLKTELTFLQARKVLIKLSIAGTKHVYFLGYWYGCQAYCSKHKDKYEMYNFMPAFGRLKDNSFNWSHESKLLWKVIRRKTIT